MAGSNGSVNDRRVAIGVFLLVLAAYIMTYNGAFKSNDERALFSGTDSFVQRGEFTANQIYWDYTHVGVFTTAGDMVPNYEPAQMVLAIPFYLWGRALGAGVQGVMFFGAVVMAASAALVYLCLLELGCGRRGSALGAFVFAFATAAWPYSRSFFREPLTILAYLLALYGLFRYRLPTPRRLLWAALSGFALGLALTTKQIGVAIIPSLMLLAIAYEWRRPADGGTRSHWGQRARMLAAFALPLIILLLLNRWYTATTLAGVETFARDVVDYTTNPQLSSSAPIRLLRASVGLTISPYKGLLWFSPALLLGLIGAIPLIRRRPWEGLALLGAVAAHLLGYSRYNYWSGGVTWGSRYMLQVVPFLVLLAAPVWVWLGETTLGRGSGVRSQDDHRSGGEVQRSGGTYYASRTTHHLPNTAGAGYALRILAWLLIAISTIIQVLGISVDYRTFEVKRLLDNAKVWGGIGQAIEGLFMRPADSPVIGHLRLLLSGTQPLDFAWVQLRPEGKWAFVPSGLLLSALLVGLALAAFVWIWRPPARRHTWRSQVWLVSGLLGVVALTTGSLLLTIYRQGDARFDPYNVDRFLRPMLGTLRVAKTQCYRTSLLSPAACGDALLVPDPTLTDYFLNYLDAPLVWYSVESEPVDEQLMVLLLKRYGRIWLVRDRNAQADDAEGRREWERYLTEHGYKVDEQKFGDWARLLRFSAAGQVAELATPHQAFGDMILDEARLGIEQRPGIPAGAEPTDDGKVQARSGETLQVGLKWRAGTKPAGDYTVFVQLLDGASQVKAQRDRWPGDGFYPTAALVAGQVITDNLALPLDVLPGNYRLIAGLYRGDQPGYPRLAGPGGDFVALAQVEVR